MHELTELVWEKSLKNNCDKVITSWLEEKCKSFLPGKDHLTKKFSESMMEHFGLSPRSCKCGACKSGGDCWWWNNKAYTVFEFCPNCGSRLGDRNE